MKRRWVLKLTALLLLLFVLLPQTQVVERPLLGQLKSRLQRWGIKFDADRLDLNLFRLQVRIQGLHVSGNGWSVEADFVSVNAGNGMLRGAIDLDEVVLRSGLIELDDALFEGDGSETSTPSWPHIRLDRFVVEDLALSARGQVLQADFDAGDVRIQRLDRRISLDLTTEQLRAGDQIVRSAVLHVVADTQDFIRFDNLEATVSTDSSHIEVAGSMDLRQSIATLQVSSQIGSDLSGYDEPVTCNAVIENDTAHWTAQTVAMVQDQRWDVNARGDLRMWRWHTDFALAFGEDVRLVGVFGADGDEWSGSFSGQAKTALLGQFPVGFDDLNLHGGLMIGEGIDVLWSAWGTGAADFEANGHWSPEAGVDGNLTWSMRDLAVTAWADQHGQAVFYVEARDDEPWLALADHKIAFEKATAMGAISLVGTQWNLDEVRGQVDGLSVVDQLLGNIDLSAHGPLTALDIRTHSDRGIEGTVLLDGQTQTLRESCFELTDFSLVYEQQPFLVSGSVRALGALDNLVVGGTFGVSTELLGSGVDLHTGFTFADSELDADWLSAAWNGIDVNLRCRFVDFDQWQATGTLISRHQDVVVSDQLVRLPLARFDFNANPKQLDLRILAPPQRMAVGDREIVIPSKLDLPLKITKDRWWGVVTDVPFEIAGLTVFSSEWTGDAESGVGQLEFAVQDWYRLRKALGNQVPEAVDLTTASGTVSLIWDPDVSPKICVALTQLDGQWDGWDAAFRTLEFSWADGLIIDRVEGRIAGMDLECDGNVGLRPIADLPTLSAGSDISCHCRLTLVDATALNDRLIENQLPLAMSVLLSEFDLESDFSFETPKATLWVDQLEATYDQSRVSTRTLGLAYDNGWYTNDNLLMYDDLPISFATQEGRLHIRSVLGVDQLKAFVPDLLGDALFWIDAAVPKLSEFDTLSAEFRQLAGTVYHPEPWMEIKNALITLEHRRDNFRLTDSKVEVNGSLVGIAGVGTLDDWQISAFGEAVPLTYGDFLGQTDLAISLQHHTGSTPVLRGEVKITDGYYTPSDTLKTFVNAMLTETESIAFPDPLLSQVDVQLVTQTPTPLLIEHELGFVTLESPDILVMGNLAQPYLASGTLYINEGSEIRIGRETYVFKESQVQFHANRPGEPYLQVFLEYGDDFSERQPIQIVGYISDLEDSGSTDGLATLLASYVLGKVSSAVSLESEQSEQLFDRSFSVVFTQPIRDKLISRIAVPIDRPSEQRVELGIGPYWDSYVSAVYENNEATFDFRRRQRFGASDVEPVRIKKIVITGYESKRIKKWAAIKAGQLFSSSTVRRSRLKIEQALMREGYLTPSLQIAFENGQLSIDVDTGKQTSFEIQGFELTERQHLEALRLIKQSGDAAEIRLNTWIKQVGLRQGYLEIQPHVRQNDHQWTILVDKGPLVSDVEIHFGDADQQLHSLVAKKEKARTFLSEYLVAPHHSEAVLRARLAAQGYVSPSIDRGSFVNPRMFVVPIRLGRKAEVARIVPEPHSDPLPAELMTKWVGAPFNYALLKTMTHELETVRRRDQRVSVTPNLVDGEVEVSLGLYTSAEPIYQEIVLEGTNRVRPEKVQRFFKTKHEAYTQSSLIQSQEELIRTGSYDAVRVLGDEHRARIILNERNRWDFEYGVAINEYEEPTIVAQFRDNLFGSGVNTFSFRSERGPNERSVHADTLFRRIFKTPFNFYVSADWLKSTRDDHPDDFTPPLQIESQRRFVFPENYKLTGEIRYPISKRSQVTLGTAYRRVIQHEEVIFYIPDFESDPNDPIDPETITEIVESKSTISLTPLNLSWLYRNLDHNSNPRTGTLMRVGVEHYFQAFGSEIAVNGTRYNAAFTSFLSRGPWMWQQRYKFGLYQPKNLIPDSFSDERDPLLFTLGGATTVRGYHQDALGPLNPSGTSVAGGEAMVFGSHELTYYTGWQGISLSGFVDAGRVWANSNDLSLDDLTVTTGLGIGWDSPVGHLHVDWAYRVEETLPQDIEFRATKDWHLRYGRTF